MNHHAFCYLHASIGQHVWILLFDSFSVVFLVLRREWQLGELPLWRWQHSLLLSVALLALVTVVVCLLLVGDMAAFSNLAWVLADHWPALVSVCALDQAAVDHLVLVVDRLDLR